MIKIKSLKTILTSKSKRWLIVLLLLKNRMHDGTLTAMDIVVIPSVEMAVRSITESSGRGPSSVVRNPDRSGFYQGTLKALRSCRPLAEKI